LALVALLVLVRQMEALESTVFSAQSLQAVVVLAVAVVQLP
jgi:hypothetical protein